MPPERTVTITETTHQLGPFTLVKSTTEPIKGAPIHTALISCRWLPGLIVAQLHRKFGVMVQIRRSD